MPVAGASVAPDTDFSWAGWLGAGEAAEGLAKRPRHARLARWLDRGMVLVAVMVCVAIYLQASLILHNKSSENVSIPSYILLVIATLAWLCYGISWQHSLISWSGLVAAIGTILALVAAVSYRPGTTPGAFATL